MATLSDYLKKQINPEDGKLVGDIPAKTPGGLDVNTPVAPAIQFLRNRFSGAGMVYGPNGWEAAPPPVAPAPPVVRAAPNPLALTAGESVVTPNAIKPTPAALQTPADLARFAPAEQKAILADAAKSGASSFDVNYQAPSVGGVRNRVAGTAPVMQQEAAPVEQAAPSGLEAYMARTGVNLNGVNSFDSAATVKVPEVAATFAPEDKYNTRAAALSDAYSSPEAQAYNASLAEIQDRRSKGLPVNSKVTDWKDAYAARTGVDVTELQKSPVPGAQLTVGRGAIERQETPAEVATRLAQWQAYYNSPEGKAEQVRQAAQPDNGMVEVVRNGVSSFENFAPGAPNPALRDYMFGQKQKEQLQQDYASAVAKPVGAKLTLGETEALKATDRAMQEQGSLGVAGIGAGAHIRAAEIGAAAGKNPLYEAAAQDIANTPEDQRASKLQQYLGGKSATAAKADPMDKVYAEQLFIPEEQQAYAGLRSLGEPPAAAFAAVREKFGAKK